jgi:hypothetical protein
VGEKDEAEARRKGRFCGIFVFHGGKMMMMMILWV